MRPVHRRAYPGTPPQPATEPEVVAEEKDLTPGREPKDQLGRSADLTAQDSKALPSSCCRLRTGQCLDAEADGGPGRAEAARLGVQIARAGQTAAERVLVFADASRQKVRSNFQELALQQPLAAHNPPP